MDSLDQEGEGPRDGCFSLSVLANLPATVSRLALPVLHTVLDDLHAIFLLSITLNLIGIKKVLILGLYCLYSFQLYQFDEKPGI
ncbi:hypothetical protein RHGRI_023206 [Rhododendron griersonianum]|uniref:Uncharacterized protein n=1 Tax=Rhododendron griersonianum TaxID=479676 RepID=A0AAV6J618_9ERIC|nr:hypothetical protein RHGRI_023206 [Rhododendron griersonianum]